MKYKCTPDELRDYLRILLKNASKTLPRFSETEAHFILAMLSAHEHHGHWRDLKTQAPWQRTLLALELNALFSLMIRCQYANWHFSELCELYATPPAKAK